MGPASETGAVQPNALKPNSNDSLGELLMEMPDNAFAFYTHPAPVPGDSFTKPLIIALLALLASRYLGGGGQKASFDTAGANPTLWKTIPEFLRLTRHPAASSKDLAGWLSGSGGRGWTTRSILG